MQNPLFKLTALASVIGAGMTVVFEAQKHLGQTGGIEQFADLSGGDKPDAASTAAAPQAAIESPTESPSAFPFAQAEPTSATADPTGEIIARGPATSTLEPNPDAFSFLYGSPGDNAPAATGGLPSQGEPLVTASLDAAPEAAGTASIQLTAAEPTSTEMDGGLKRFPVAGGAPTLLAPPTTPPTPPRPGEESLAALDASASGLVQADLNIVQNQFADMVQTVAGTTAEATASNDQLAQADPFPATTDRTRDPVAPPPVLNQSEPLDLFGTLPTPTGAANTPLPAPEPNGDVLVLPAGVPATTTGEPSLVPSPIPGTSPGELPFPTELTPTPTPAPEGRTRTPAPTAAAPSSGTPDLFPALTPATTSPAATAPSPIPNSPTATDLFLPQDPAPARATADNSIVLPPGTASDDPFATTAAPAISPTVAAPLQPIAPVAPPADRTRSPVAQPTPTAAESPFYPTDAALSPQPRRTAEPPVANDPFPVFPETAPNRNAEPALILPEPLPANSPTPSAPTPSSFPSFPTSNDLGGASPLPTPAPSRSSIPTNAPTPAPSPLTFPDRSSLPTTSPVPARSLQPEFNASTAPARSTIEPFPSGNDLAGTGTFDSTAPAGLQPELQIEKDAPPKAVLNQQLVYTIRVRNVGRSAAHQVIVEDAIPKGTTLAGTNPQAEQDPTDKHLFWRIGTLAPAEERLIHVKVIPVEPGEIGSVATVRFTGRIAAKTIITAPRIKLEMNGPAETAVGDVPVYRFRISNMGDGEATNVVVKSSLPNVFEHPSGRELEYTVGSLPAGQSRDMELALSAVRPGQASQAFVVLVGEQEQDRTTADVVVLASRISIERTGPEKRFVNRPANYVTQVTNQSSEPLRNVTVVETLPTGVELAQVPQHGRYDPSRRTITWVLPQLGPQETQQIHSSLVTADQGAYVSKVQVWDAAGNKAEASSELQVAGFSALRVDMAQTTQGGGEVAIGDQVALRLTVANQGSAVANNVVTEFEIPPELEFVAARPPQFELVNGKVRFPAIPTLDKNGSQVIDIVCVARQPGRPQIAASIWSAEQESPIRQAEAVVVFREEP